MVLLERVKQHLLIIYLVLCPNQKSFFLLKHMLPFNTFKEELIIQDQILILFVLIVLQEELICQIMILFLWMSAVQ